MIKSMTGYGKDSLEVNLREYQVEIKTVNHKYIDITLRIPKIMNYLEDEIRKLINSKIKRGKVDILISFDNYGNEGHEIKINYELAKLYIANLKQLAIDGNISSNIDAIEISKMPEVLEIKSSIDEEKIRKEILNVVENAINQVINMRKIEGIKMSEDILMKISQINSKIEEIFTLSTGLIEEYVVKLETRVKELLKTQEIDKSRLLQEIVIYADKCSVEEEITRMKSHILQITNLIQSDEPVGKKIDFIIQEMNRETNTIGSKANNLEITNKVIDIKTILEDIREQVQNIE